MKADKTIKYLTWDSRKHKKVLVGEINGDTLIKKVNPLTHFMRVVGGYGIQYEALLDLLTKVKHIKVIETEGETWETTPKIWQEHCHIADYGSGKQAFLSLKYMTRHKKEEEPFDMSTLYPPKKEEDQKTLF